jgi:hypothetical protein
MSEAEAIHSSATNRVMQKAQQKSDGGVGFFKSIDWIKAAKELGFPVVAGGFLIWKMSSFVDVSMRASERTADSVQTLNERHVQINNSLDRQTQVLERIDRGQDKLIDRLTVPRPEVANKQDENKKESPQ